MTEVLGHLGYNAAAQQAAKEVLLEMRRTPRADLGREIIDDLSDEEK